MCVDPGWPISDAEPVLAEVTTEYPPLNPKVPTLEQVFSNGLPHELRDDDPELPSTLFPEA